MVPTGDDFAFLRAREVFNQVDALITQLTSLGEQKGYNTTVKYSNLYKYFDDLQKLNLDYGLFKGDFLPYQEPWYGWDDFWTGYYSTRMHLKRNIRYMFNQIQKMKTFLAIRSVQKNNGSVKFSEELERLIDETNQHIRTAEQNWSILMHHDGITGTHTIEAENSYYQMLKTSRDELVKSFDLINERISISHGLNLKKKYETLEKKFAGPSLRSFTFLNPTVYERHEVVNVTSEYHTPGAHKYLLFLQNPNGKNLVSIFTLANSSA